MVSALSALLLGAGALVAAAPASSKSANCTFSGSNGAAQAAKSKTSCSTIILNNVAVPKGTTLDLTGLNDGTTVIFQGTTTVGYTEWKGPLIDISGTRITVKGDKGHLIDLEGKRWWDGKGSNGGKTKPKFFSAHKLIDSTISNLSIKNTPVQAFSVNQAQRLTLDHITIDNSEGDYETGGHNTDAFDVGSSSDITISNANIKNQDDCLAINSGTNIHFTGGTCSGGHGLSIGSVGGRTDNVVDGVVIEHSTIADSDNGVRVKTVSGATGTVNNVTYRDIKLSNIAKYGIVLQQDYENGSPTGKPTNGVPITGFTLDGVTGSVTAKAQPIYILCGSDSCKNWTWKGVSVSGGKTGKSCMNVPQGASC